MSHYDEGWIERWNTGSTPWHIDEVHPLLREYRNPLWDRVLVPLCGASRDLAWLAEQGHEVVGVELAASAADTVFEVVSDPPERRSGDGFEIRRSGRLTMVIGDMLALDEGVAGTVDAVWDRAGLVALRPEQRAAYFRVLRDVAARADLLLVTLDYDPSLMDGPPFHVTDEQVHEWFDDVRLLCEDAVEDLADRKGLPPDGIIRRTYRARIPASLTSLPNA